MKIGVFDSGIGGQAVAAAIHGALPELEIMVREDRNNLPYGNKQPDELLRLVSPIILEMQQAGCQAIVIACNTVSTTIIDDLRKLASISLISVEPMVKPAAEQTKSSVIAICATPATLASNRYIQLKELFAGGITILEPDCSDWAAMIESNNVNMAKVGEMVESLVKQQADVIVLACTHYHWIEEEIRQLSAGRAVVIQPEQAIIRQLKRVLEQLA